MKFLANENIPLASVKCLIEKGYDVKSIGLDHFGISDEEVMAIAMKEDRTILTHDSDYGELIFKKGFKPNSGVVFLRIQPSFPEESGVIISNLIQNRDLDFRSALTVVNENGVRQKKY